MLYLEPTVAREELMEINQWLKDYMTENKLGGPLQSPISPTDASARQTRAHTTPSPHLDHPDRGALLGSDPIPMASCKGSP